LSLAFAANTTAAEERGIENGGGRERKKKFWKTFRFPAERETQTADIFIRFKCRVWRRTEEEEEEKEAAECWQFNETSSPSCGIDCCCLGVLGPRV
jgi:hypothetical protein